MDTPKIVKVEKFVAAPNGEVLGISMLSLPVCIGADEIMPIFERHGIAQIDPDRWYSQQIILNVYKDIVEGRTNVSDNLVSIGVKSTETMALPPEINSVEAVLGTLSGSYSIYHRNTWPGEGTEVRYLGEGHAQSILNVPYPNDIFYGYYWGLMRRYVPKGMKFRITYLDSKDVPSDISGTVCDFRWGHDL